MIKINHPITKIHTDKFKTITFLLRFRGTFSRKSLIARTLLCRVMKLTTMHYPSKKELTQAMFDLYNANVSISYFSMYETNITFVYIKIVNPKFVDEPHLLQASLQMLEEVLYHPNATESGFDNIEFYEEKQKLKDQYAMLYHDKNRFALERMLEIMAPNELVSLPPFGTLEEIEAIQPLDLWHEYHTLMQEDKKLYVLGNMNESDLSQYFLIENGQSHNTDALCAKTTPIVTTPKEVIETQKINQSILVMGYRMDVDFHSCHYIPMMVFNAMFGGMAISDLFQIVREKNSLAYSIYSNTYFDHRVFTIQAGINASNYVKTKKLITKILQSYQSGEIDSELLNKAKQWLIGGLKEKHDENISYLLFLVRRDLLDYVTSEELIEQVSSVTAKDIKKASQTLSLDTIYCLKGSLR